MAYTKNPSPMGCNILVISSFGERPAFDTFKTNLLSSIVGTGYKAFMLTISESSQEIILEHARKLMGQFEVAKLPGSHGNYNTILFAGSIEELRKALQ